MNIVYGFGGLISDGERLSLNPVLPDEWKLLRFPLSYRGSRMLVTVTREDGSLKTAVTLTEGQPVAIMLNGEEYRVE
jgi:maltose phosphorylase